MQIKSSGNAVVVTSTITMAEFRAAQQYDRNALCIKDEDGDSRYAISYGVEPQLAAFGAVFNGHTMDEAQQLTLTFTIPQQETVEAKMNYLRAEFGNELAALANNEGLIKQQIQSATARIDRAFADAEIE